MRNLKALLLIIFFLPGALLYGLQNNTGAHDPTGIIKSGNTYWIFATGNGINSLYSRDLISWTYGRTPFSRNVYPSWIHDYVPGFEGNFWAPECVYMNGKYHLYYSCSTWGSKNSCIGLVTNETLNPNDPNYLWVDKGVVVHSNTSSDANCIDPSVYKDEMGDYYMSYGSYFGGIRIVQLDSLSGMVSGSYRYPVASGNCEASYVIHHEGYYYLFINRGSCCRGVSSTYYIQVGRSLAPTGPFLDKEGVDMNAGGGSTILSTNGSFIGPGHVGYYVENGEEWVSYHYYDGDNNGSPSLAIGTMEWDEDWPAITNNFIREGDYLLLNHNSQMVMQTALSAGEGSPVTQGAYTSLANQIWHLSPVGNGYYSMSLGNDHLVVETEGCSATSGASLNLGTDNYMPCEHWKFERTKLLEYVISCRAGNNVLNVPAPAFEEGTVLQTAVYSGIASHYWEVRDTALALGYPGFKETVPTDISLYPNPWSEGSLSILVQGPFMEPMEIDVISMDGRLVHSEKGLSTSTLNIQYPFSPGIYIVRLTSGPVIYEKKLIVNSYD